MPQSILTGNSLNSCWLFIINYIPLLATLLSHWKRQYTIETYSGLGRIDNHYHSSIEFKKSHHFPAAHSGPANQYRQNAFWYNSLTIGNGPISCLHSTNFLSDSGSCSEESFLPNDLQKLINANPKFVDLTSKDHTHEDTRPACRSP